MKYRSIFTVVAMVLTLGILPSAHADSVVFTFANTTQYSTSPGVVTYYGTLSAPITNLHKIIVSGADRDVDAPIILDDTDYYINFPLSLEPGQSYTGDFRLIVLEDTPLEAVMKLALVNEPSWLA